MSRRSLATTIALAVVCTLVPALAPKPAGGAPRPTKVAAVLSPRLDAVVARVTTSTSDAGEARLAGVPSTGPGSLLRQPDGDLTVNARLRSVDAEAERRLARAGASVVARSETDRLVTLAVASTDLEAVAAVAGVEWVEEVLEPRVHRTTRAELGRVLAEGGVATASACGDRIVSEADVQLGAAAARTTHGVDGTGVQVGILSDSYDNLGGAAADVAAGELPGSGNPCGRTTPVVVQADLASGGTDEGRAMAQAVHDLAPGASIAFATAFNGDVDFANQIRALAAGGAQVIVDDISYFNEPIYQDGIIAKAIADVTAQGVTYFSSAGNSNLVLGGREVASYETMAYRPATCPTVVANTGSGDCHDLDPGAGVDVGDGLTLAPGGYVRIKLGWNQPQYGITTDLDLFLVDTVTGSIVASALVENLAGSRQAYEYLSYTNGTGVTRTFDLVVARYGAGGTPRLKRIIVDQGSLIDVEHDLASGSDVIGPSAFGHNMTPSAGSIAAIRYDTTAAPETFSARGPATYCWAPVSGTTAASALGSCLTDHLDVTATDGAANSFFGGASGAVWRFYGTSQAAPHAAAVAALQAQAQPCRTPAEILAAQRSSALPIGSYGQRAVGSGLLSASGAIAALAPCVVLTVPEAPTGVSAVAGDGQATVSWSAPSVDGGSEVTGYVVTPYVGVVPQSPRIFASTATSQVITGLDNGTAYRFTVAATNALGTGPESVPSSAVTPRAPYAPFASWEAMADRLSVDLLGRSATGSERAAWVAELSSGSTTPGVWVAALRAGDDHRSNVDTVARLYRAYFLRSPDRSGFDYWLRQRRVTGRKLALISSTFAGSSEFRTRYGTLSNRGFVELVYRNVLGREGDPGGIAYWTGRLDARRTVRGQVMLNFSESNEYRTGEAATVEASVQHLLLLGRTPTPTELDSLVAELEAGDLTPAALAARLLAGSEFATRVGA